MFTKNEAKIKICTENLKSKTKYHNSDALYTKAILKGFIIMLPSKTPHLARFMITLKAIPECTATSSLKKYERWWTSQ